MIKIPDENASNLLALRSLLYDVLRLHAEPEKEVGDLLVFQQQHVALSPGLKNRPVNIFQGQAVVSRQVTTKIVEALRILDTVDDWDSDGGIKKYIEELPQPRLKNLVKKVYEIALVTYPTQLAGGRWLGVNQVMMCRQNKLLQEKEEKR